jgi:putative Mn2+ efflux pump MntP
MGVLETILTAVSLAMDAAAVCLGVGATPYGGHWRARFRLSFHFGLFQFLMPVLGWWIGTAVEQWVKSVDHWIALGLLVLVGGRMMREGLNEDQETHASDPSRGASLVMLSVATSIDAMAVGLSLAFLGNGIWAPAATIGVITGLLSLAAMHLGARMGQRGGKRMEVVGGAVLCLIGLRILWSHLG